MKSTLTTLGVSFGFLLVCALSMGNRTYLLLALLIVIAWLLAYLSVRMAEKSVRVSHGLTNTRVNRGENVAMQVSVSHRGLLPIAPVKLKMRATSNTPSGVLHLAELGRRTQKVAYQFAAEHIGAMIPGVESYTVSDVFGFFKKEHVPDNSTGELLVLPVPFEVEPLTFAPGDMGVETMKRAMEDPSSPSDFRAYQNGDPMKRIHWKMSARKREIMIRQFEEPALPDALVLMDTSPPNLPKGMDPGKMSYLKDAILETAASVVKCQISLENPVHLPLVGDRPMDYVGSMGLPILLEELARCTFNETEKFERMILLQMNDLRKTGAVVVITTRLTSVLVDLIGRMKRMGPNVRLYLVSYEIKDPTVQDLVARLQQRSVEVNYVSPQG